MADFLSHKLLEFPSLNTITSLPFHVSLHLSFSTVYFSPPRRRSSPPISCRLSPHTNSPSISPPSPIVIVSTTECSDGSVVFKFGDPSEIVEDESDSRNSDLGEEEGLDEEENEANVVISSPKEGSIPKKINNKRFGISSAKAASVSKTVKKDDIVISSAKSGSVSKAVKKDDIVFSSAKSGSISKEINKNEIIKSSGKHRSSDVAVLKPNVVEMNKGHVEEKVTSTSLLETRVDFHEESEGKLCSSDNVGLEPSAVGMKTGNVVELTAFHTDANERGIKTSSDGVEERETSPSMIENRTDFDMESGGNRIDEFTSPKLGKVVDVEISSPSEEEALGEITDDDVMSSEVSFELDLSNEGCDSNEVVEIDENILNVDSSDSVVDVGGSATVDYKVELMPKHARLEADLVLEEEIDEELPSDLLSAKSFVNSVVVDESACHTILADERTDSDVGSNEISDCGVAIEQSDTISRGEEVSSPTLTLASGVASLPCPSQSQVLTGVEDAYFVADDKWFIVANSVGQWSLEGMKQGLYAHELIQNYQSLTSNNDSCEANLREALKQSAATVQSPGLASVLIAHFDKEVLHVANIGDTGFIMIRSGVVHKSSTPIIHEFNLPVQIGSSDDPLEVAEEYRVHVEDGDVIIMATDGLFDNLYEKDIASVVSKSLQDKLKPKELAELLATRAQEVGRSKSVNSPFADEAQAAGYAGYSGGKLDHVTVIVSMVKKQLTIPQTQQ